MTITKCPTCGSKTIRQVRRNVVRESQGHSYTIPNLEFNECPKCGEKVYDRETMRRIEAHNPALAKQSSA